MKKLVVGCIAALGLAACGSEPAHNPGSPPALEAPTLPMQDAAGNRMEGMGPPGPNGICTQDGAWCVLQDGEVRNGANSAGRLPPATEGISLWPVIVRLADSRTALLGVVRTQSQMYSGGDGSSGHLTLYQFGAGAAREVGVIPLGGVINIRACFDEDDQKNRLGACGDQYWLVSRIALDETSAETPRLTLQTEAATFPGARSRSADSSAKPPLEQSDLVWARDETCSFNRVYARGADG
ncbi:MAG TPA: hypothetical protein PLK37_14215, partial [Terricaulis sp.]|nr:hypothetical protein [Terricaulis sp.]